MIKLKKGAPVNSDDTTTKIEQLLAIMRRFRDPENGCPWDQTQNFKTIAPYTIEEAHEVADAILRDDMFALCDELGDLLLQVVYHAQMAEEIDAFCFHDVVAAISAKMLRRNPHVFGNEQEIAAGKPDWEELKVAERDDQSDPSNRLYDKSALAGVGVGQGPWVVARKLQKKASKVNFDWPDAKGVLAKVHEELAEIEEAMLQLEQTPDAISEAAVEDELGDVLFSVINLSRHLKLDSGNALQKANYKFESRFRCMEQQIKAEGLQMSALSADELEQRWQQAKRQTQG